MKMTYADQLNILSASLKLKRDNVDMAFKKMKKGFKNEKPILKYLAVESELLLEYQYYIKFFIFCVRNIEDINTQSEFDSI